MIAAGVFALVGVAALGGLWLIGKSGAVGPFACAGYEFARGEWRGSNGDAKREQARLIARCDHLVGKTRRQVRRDLGSPDGDPRADREWRFFIGRKREFLRLGDSGHLVVRFNRRGRVARTVLPEPGD